MIIDWIFGALLSIISALLGVLPDMPPPPTFATEAQDAATSALLSANYFVPVRELMVLLGVMFTVQIGLVLYRFVMRLIP